MTSQNIKNIRRNFVLFLIHPFIVVAIVCLRLTTASCRVRWAKYIAKLTFKYNKTSRKRTISGLTTAYGDTKTEQEIVDMAKETLFYVTKAVLDFYATSHITNKEKYFKLVKVEGEEYLKEAYQQGKGVICLVPHLSSWELAAVTPPMLGYTTSAASKEIKGFLIQRMMVRFRQRRGMKNISREGSYDQLVKRLKQGDCLIVMIDQDTKVRGLFVDFYGKKAYTPMGVARLALDTDAIVVPMAMTHDVDGNYKFIIKPALKTVRTENTEQDLYDNTQLQTAALEEIIKAYPTQWVWMHRRWKTTPESLQSYLKRREEEKRKKK